MGIVPPLGWKWPLIIISFEADLSSGEEHRALDLIEKSHNVFIPIISSKEEETFVIKWSFFQERETVTAVTNARR